MLNRRRVVQGGLAAARLARPSPRRFVRARRASRRSRSATTRWCARCSTRRPTSRITKGYFKDAGLDVTLTTAQGGDKSVAALLSNSADIALIGPETGDLRAEQRLADQDADLLRAHRDRRLHADGPREGRQVRLEHAQGQGDPRLPPGQHAAPVPRSGDAAERHRPAEGRQAQQQRRDPGARRLLARRPEPVRASSSSPTPRSSSSTARRTSSPRSARPSGPADYTTFMATDKYIKENPAVIQTWTDAIYQGA